MSGNRIRGNAESFSFLYLANVLGAMCGTFLTAVVFVEVWGFHHTLWQAAAGNFTVAFISVCLGCGAASAAGPSEKPARSRRIHRSRKLQSTGG